MVILTKWFLQCTVWHTFTQTKKTGGAQEEIQTKSIPQQAVPDQGSDDDVEVGEEAVSLDATADYKKQL